MIHIIVGNHFVFNQKSPSIDRWYWIVIELNCIINDDKPFPQFKQFKFSFPIFSDLDFVVLEFIIWSFSLSRLNIGLSFPRWWSLPWLDSFSFVRYEVRVTWLEFLDSFILYFFILCFSGIFNFLEQTYWKITQFVAIQGIKSDSFFQRFLK